MQCKLEDINEEFKVSMWLKLQDLTSNYCTNTFSLLTIKSYVYMGLLQIEKWNDRWNQVLTLNFKLRWNPFECKRVSFFSKWNQILMCLGGELWVIWCIWVIWWVKIMTYIYIYFVEDEGSKYPQLIFAKSCGGGGWGGGGGGLRLASIGRVSSKNSKAFKGKYGFGRFGWGNASIL